MSTCPKPSPAQLKREHVEDTMKLTRLLIYVLNMQEDYPELDWPALPDTYSDQMWRYAA